MGAFTTMPRDPNKGCHGINYALVANYADVVGTIDASGYCTFASGEGDPSTAFTKFTPRKETSNWTETGTGNAQQGSTFYNQVATLVFPRNDIVKRNNLAELGDSEVIAVLVERGGSNIALGVNNGLDLTAPVSGSGTAPGDLSGITMVLSGNECDPHSFLTDAELANITPE